MASASEPAERIRRLVDAVVHGTLAAPDGYAHSWRPGPVSDVPCRPDVPAHLAALWALGGELRLYEDEQYGQWGLVMWAERDALSVDGTECAGNQRSWVQHVRGDRRRLPGDVVVGEFRGDLDFVVVRCDAAAADFGRTTIRLPLDERSEWPVWDDVASFLEDFVAHDGEKHWPH